MYIYEVPNPNETVGQKVRRTIREKVEEGREWYYWHRNDVLLFGPVVIGGITTIAKVVGKRVNLRKAEEVKNLYCYDRSLGHYWALRRELTNKEWLAIDQRKRNGERMSDILAEMKVLK